MQSWPTIEEWGRPVKDRGYHIPDGSGNDAGRDGARPITEGRGLGFRSQLP
jgi:hypothetical protein